MGRIRYLHISGIMPIQIQNM